MPAHTASSSLGVRIYMASSSSVCAEWGHREHQRATATALSKCIVCAARTDLPSQPPTRRLRRACDSGTTYIGTPSEPLGAVAQPLPGPVSSARGGPTVRHPSFACVRHRNKPAPELVRGRRTTHACFCKMLQPIRSADVRVPFHVAIDVWLALTRRREAPYAAENGANSSTGSPRVENNHRARAAGLWASLLGLTFGPHCSCGRPRPPLQVGKVPRVSPGGVHPG
jgi:hypothetical protein